MITISATSFSMQIYFYIVNKLLWNDIDSDANIFYQLIIVYEVHVIFISFKPKY